jgi:hypothetical protein
MPKWLLFGLAGVADLVVAVLTYRSGRIVFPAILTLAGALFLVAAVGSAMGKGQ